MKMYIIVKEYYRELYDDLEKEILFVTTNEVLANKWLDFYDKNIKMINEQAEKCERCMNNFLLNMNKKCYIENCPNPYDTRRLCENSIRVCNFYITVEEVDLIDKEPEILSFEFEKDYITFKNYFNTILKANI